MKNKQMIKRFWYGAPLKRCDRKKFEKAILERFSVEGAVDFMSSIVDRQITKAIGLLTVNTILFAAFTNTNVHNGHNHYCILTYASIAVLISSLLLICIMYVIWEDGERYHDAQQDFRSTCKIVYFRSYILTISLGCSFAALLAAIFFKICIIFNSSIYTTICYI